jgi:signal peptidase
LGLVVASAFGIWKSLMLLTKSESPIVVVLSGSMEPAYYRGDILFLTHWDEPIKTGDVIVFKLSE